MRKGALTWIAFTFVILCMGLISAASTDYVDNINRAFNCLDNRVSSASLTLEEAIFTALTKSQDQKVWTTINQQKSSSAECWPSSGCNVKTTAQVALAKLRKSENITAIVAWLEAQSSVTQQMQWYLQISIDSNEPASCVVNYDDVDHPVTINEEMKLLGNPGSCLSVTPSGYWLRIGAQCLDKEYNIQCDKNFKTNLLYEKSTGGTIYVSPETHGASAGSWTNEQVNARCFKEGTSCNYESSLWAATAIYADGKNLSRYAPYLRALAADNERYFPSAFLVAILEGGNEHYSKIIDSARARPEGSYWQMPSSPHGKFYDTALGMLALGGADSQEIENLKVLGYLFTNQDESGCWGGGNIQDTAFIIYSARWQRDTRTTGYCGDGAANNGEACDGLDLRGQNCISKNYSGGNLSCMPAGANNACTFNVSQCTPATPAVCGNGVISGAEVCDCGSDGSCTSAELNGTTCATAGNYGGGTLGCAAGCLSFNVSQCYSGGGPNPPGGNGTGNGTGGGGSYNPNLLTNCELADLFCAPSQASCKEAGGSFFPQSSHACSSPFEFCCTVEVVEASCASLNGVVCPWAQSCTAQTVESQDGNCCVAGTCEAAGCASDFDCPAGQVCELGICTRQSSLECNGDDDCGSGEICQNNVCIDEESGGSSWWIWIIILIVLIALVVVGIFYRDKLRVWWYKVTGKVKTSKPGTSGPPGSFMGRRPPPSFGPPGAGQTRMLPPAMRPNPIRVPTREPLTKTEPKNSREKEEEETLRKLKEMSK